MNCVWVNLYSLEIRYSEMHVLKFKQNNCRPWLYHLHHHWRPWTIIQWIINSSLKLIGRSNQSTVPTHLHPNISGGFDHALEELKRLQLQVCVMVQMIFNPSGYCKFEDEFFQTGTMMQIWHWHWGFRGVWDWCRTSSSSFFNNKSLFFLRYVFHSQRGGVWKAKIQFSVDMVCSSLYLSREGQKNL